MRPSRYFTLFALAPVAVAIAACSEPSSISAVVRWWFGRNAP